MRFLLLLLLGAGPLLADFPPTNTLPPRVAVPLPAFVLRNLAHREVKLTDFKSWGKLVVFIVHDSKPCNQQSPALRELACGHAHRPVAVLLLAMDDAKATATKNRATEKLPNLPVLLAHYKTINGLGGVTGEPCNLLLGSQHACYLDVTPIATLNHTISTILPP